MEERPEGGKGVNEAISWGLEGVFQAEGTANTTALRQESAWKVQEGARKFLWLDGISQGIVAGGGEWEVGHPNWVGLSHHHNVLEASA